MGVAFPRLEPPDDWATIGVAAPVRWGLLSTARINDKIIAAVSQTPSCEIVAVASRDTERATAYAAEHNIPSAYGDYDALLADETVDAVYIGLPNSMHVEWAMRAVMAGKHVLVEKPLTRHATEARALARAAEDAGVIVSEAFMWRHHPQVAQAKALLADGQIGILTNLRASFSFDVYATRGAEDTRVDPKLDGGCLMDVGCYCVNGLRTLAGAEPVRVMGQQFVDQSGVDVTFAGMLTFPGGLVGHFDASFVRPFAYGLEAVGTTGTLVFHDPWHATKPENEIRRPEGVQVVDVPEGSHYQRQMENLAAAIHGVAPLTVPMTDAIAQARVIEALYRSAETNQVVELA